MRLREMRLDRGLSQEELHKATGISRDTISRLETGKRRAHPRTVRKLAEALGVAPWELRSKSDG